MGLFSSKRNPANEIIAANSLKIINDCASIVNTTKNPDIFFPRWELMEQHVEKLCHLKGVKFSGTPPLLLKKQLKEKKQAAIRNMIDRYYQDINAKARNIKTVSGKISRFSSFITNLEDYFELMSQENIDYVNQLYDNAKSKLIKVQTKKGGNNNSTY